MNRIWILCAVSVLLVQLSDAAVRSPYARLTGRIGSFLQTVLERRIYSEKAKGVVYDEAERSFQTHWDDSLDENGRVRNGWQNEYWGKMMLCYAGAIAYTGDSGLSRWAAGKARSFVDRYQHPNGYLSTYAQEDGLAIRDADANPGLVWNFNIWGRKYTMWALLELASVTGDRELLAASVKMADHLCAQLDRLGVGIESTGSWAGLSSMTVLKPLMLLYRERPKPAYLALARHIMKVMDRETSDPRQMNLVRDALSDRPVCEWFGKKAMHMAKAYEMMSFFEGVAEYYRATGEERALSSLKAFHRHLVDEELNPMRCVGYFDHFLRGRRHVNGLTELCDVVHWMRLNRELYLLTGDTVYLDCFEEAFYNALLPGVSPDGEWGAHIVRSHGTRHMSAPPQTGMIYHQCCPDNMLRAFFDWATTVAVEKTSGVIDLNLFSDAEVELDGVGITVSGGYPVEDSFRIALKTDRDVRLRVRVPTWSGTVTVDGREMPVSAGRVDLKAAKGDTVWSVSFDMKPRIIQPGRHDDEDVLCTLDGQSDWFKPSYTLHFMEWMTPEMRGLHRTTGALQVMRGPLVLAKGRLAGTTKAETLYFESLRSAGWEIGSLTPVPRRIDNISVWGAWTLEFRRGGERKAVPVSDFWSVSCVNDPSNWFSMWF